MPPYNGTILIKGYTGIEPSCAASIIKTWTAAVPPSDLFAVAITSGRCIFNTNRQTTILSNQQVYGEGFNGLYGYKFRQYSNVASSSYWAQRLINSTSLKRINFAVQNIIDVAIIQLNTKAIDLYNEGFKFYRLSTSPPVENSAIVSIGYQLFMRSTSGLIQTTNITYNSGFGGTISNAFGHSSNLYSTGAPILSAADNSTIQGIATEQGNPASVTYNYAFPVYEIATCFSDNGLFTMNAPSCLTRFKQDWLNKYNQSLDGLRYVPIETQAAPNATVADIIPHETTSSTPFDTYEEQVKWSSSNRVRTSLMFLTLLLV